MSTQSQLGPKIEAALDEYKATYRRSGLPEWLRGELLALFAEECAGQATRTWQDPWPLGNRAGVYFVFDRDMSLLYIGKASMSSCLGARLSYWFWGSTNKPCNITGNWAQKPCFVLALGMPDGMAFEAPALEEFLIGRLSPPENTAGRKQ